LEKYKIISINFDTAFKVWESSPNANIYNNPIFLKNYKNVTFLGAFKGDEINCCWPIFKNKKKILIPNFFYYFGPFWSKKIFELPAHSWLSTSLNIYSKFIEYLTKNCSKISFQFHHSLLDIRAFDWWNFGYKTKKKFLVKPKYSAIINLENIDHKQIMSNYRYVRRYEIKNFIKNGYEDKIEMCGINFKEISEIYIKSNTSNLNKIQKKHLFQDIKNICNLANKKFGAIQCFKDKYTNKIVYFNVVLFDKNSIHLVLNCSNEIWKKKGIMAWGLNNLFYKYVGKYKYFDFNGANSPLRGDDKHSYGSYEKLYFQLEY